MADMPTKTELKRNLKALRGRLEKRPMDLDARMRMARTHRLLAEKRQAVAHYRAVARYLSLAGHPLQAIAVLKELLQVDPKHEETLLFLAKLYARTAGAERSTMNVGRVAVPIADPPTGPIALPEGLPASATGVWRAIRPMSTDVFTAIHEADEVGAHAVSIADELRELEENTLDIDEEDVLEEQELDPLAGVPDLEDYELLGPVTTEDLVLPKVTLFSSLDAAAFISLGHAMVFQRAGPGDVIFKEGDPGDSCLVIAHGRAVATRTADDGEEIELMRLEEGGFAGLFALLAAQHRQANLRAETHLEYFEIDRLAIAKLLEEHPSVKPALRDLFAERLVLNLLAVLPLFAELDADTRLELAGRFVRKTYEPEDELFYPLYEADGLWVILEGEARVVGLADDRKTTLVPGDFVGSFAGVHKGQTKLSTVANTQVAAALLTHKELADLLAAHRDLDGVDLAFQNEGLMLDTHVFAGSGRLPGGFTQLKAVFRDDD